jgi:hypothetical protein
MAMVDAVVEDRDLHAATRGAEVGSPQDRRLDRARALAEGARVVSAWIDPAHPADGGEGRQAACGERDGERVQNDPIAAANLSARDLALDPTFDAALHRGERAEVARAVGGTCVEPALGSGRQDAAFGHGTAQRGRVELDDDLGRGRVRDAGSGEGEEANGDEGTTPAQGSHRTYNLAATICASRGCGGIGRRARFRSVWAKARGGSSPLIRIPG